TAVDQHNQLLPAQTKLVELASVHHFFNRLEFGEVVSGSKRSKPLVKRAGLKALFAEYFTNPVSPNVLEIERDLCPAVELHVPACQASLEQSHTAANVSADEVRINESFRYKRGAHRAALSRMQIRKTGNQAHPFKFCRSVKLTQRLPFNPA